MTEPEPERRSTWIPYAFVGFFLFVFAVNGVMVGFALNSFSGLSTEQAYDRGLRYNAEIAGAEAQRDLGWRPETAYVGAGPSRGTLELRLTAGDGSAVTGARVTAQVVRPTHQGHDFAVDLAAAGDGVYVTAIELPLPGLWEVRFLAIRGDRSYRVHDRFLVK